MRRAVLMLQNETQIERILGGLSVDTSTTKWFAKIYLQTRNYMPHPRNFITIDPFSRDCMLADLRNDIDPDTKAEYHLDAIEFLKGQPTRRFDLVIFDPPFSPTQTERNYGDHCPNIYTIPNYVANCMKEIERVVKSGGHILKFGFNSTRHRPTFDLKRTWLISHGANHNDTIVTLWRKEIHSLDEWE
jgi:hypothetical protein